MAKTILVTGGAGFVGSHLCRRLLEEGNRVISLDNYFAGSRGNDVPGVECRDGHTKDIATFVPEKPDIIFHLGEYARVEQSVLEPDVVHDLNVVGTAAVIEYWRSRNAEGYVCKLIYAGSSTKFGDGGMTPQTSPYAATKAANTIKVRDIGEREHLPYAVTYFYNVYGPGERAGIYGTVIEWFKEMHVRGEPLTVVSPGTQQRNFTHVFDIVDALMVVGEKGKGDEFGIGAERAYTMLEVAHLFGGEVVMLPSRPSNRMTSALHTEKTRALGWEPMRDLASYIREFVAAHPRGEQREQRVLVLSTSFFPTEGPAERALRKLAEALPDVQFDVVAGKFTDDEVTGLPKNITLHAVGMGHSLDKFLLPILGFHAAYVLHREHRYLFAWSLMASYAALAGVMLKYVSSLPLLITFADQNFEKYGFIKRVFLDHVVREATQVYGLGNQEARAAHVRRGKPLRQTLGEGDAFANQLRYAYAQTVEGERSL